MPGPLKLLYLTHLRLGAAASSLAMQALLHFVWEQVQHPAGAHAMCFREPPDVSLHGWLAHRSSGTLYSVVPTGHVAHAQLHAAASAGPLPFELAVA